MSIFDLSSDLSMQNLLASANQAVIDSLADVFFIFIIISLILGVVVLLIVSSWEIFQKAGKPGWASLVPFYNMAVLIEITRKPLWWLPILILVPVVNIVLTLIIYRRLAAVFGKGVWFTLGLIFLPFIFFPMLAFGSAQYNNHYALPAPMSNTVRWTLISVLLYTLSLAFTLLILQFALTGVITEQIAEIKSPLRDENGNLTNYSVYEGDIFYNNTYIANADLDTFEIINDEYAKDAFSVYYGGVQLEAADPETFFYVPNGSGETTPYSYDADDVYYYSSLLEGVDSPSADYLYDYYLRDAFSVWYVKQIFDDAKQMYLYAAFPIDADIATFEYLPNRPIEDYDLYDAKDKDGYFNMGERVEFESLLSQLDTNSELGESD